MSPTLSILPLLSVFPLHLFPESGLSRSIITTVFVGLVVMVFMNEAFGWVFSGLVVPGYLAPILLIQPWSALIIVIEALLTHGLVRFFSDTLSRAGPRGLGPWREFFGRDRFFAYLLFGVLIRAVGEGFLFHAIGALLNDKLGLSIDYRNNFYSVGLIVVPLLGNMFWKPGIRRGLVPVGVSIGLTYAVIRYVLIPCTNFSISSFELSYGYYATTSTGHTKAYLVLLVSAYLASRANL
ncbi:MAG: poly-gamma-glutamate biosynthesis protein PgsC/CapC, partial [Polyangiaceae bacterium]